LWITFGLWAKFQRRDYSLALTDKNGVTLKVFPAQGGVKREWTDVQDVPQGVRNVFIKAEDKWFYCHIGIDPVAVIARTIRNAATRRVVSGASTITMQLARLIKPHARGLGGKIVEAVDALRLEARLSKDAILEMWLNAIPFGSNIEGLGAFSRTRFGVTAAELDDVRAVAPRCPSLYDPVYNAEASLVAARQLAVRCGVDPTAGAAAIAEAAAPADVPAANAKTPFHAPHFTERACSLLSNYAESSGGAFKGCSQRPVKTTLDLDLQLYAEERLGAELVKLSLNRAGNGSILAIENSTGAVLCYVGSAS
jgi:penicillin-binding protein 1C